LQFGDVGFVEGGKPEKHKYYIQPLNFFESFTLTDLGTMFECLFLASPTSFNLFFLRKHSQKLTNNKGFTAETISTKHFKGALQFFTKK